MQNTKVIILGQQSQSIYNNQEFISPIRQKVKTEGNSEWKKSISTNSSFIKSHLTEGNQKFRTNPFIGQRIKLFVTKYEKKQQRRAKARSYKFLEDKGRMVTFRQYGQFIQKIRMNSMQKLYKRIISQNVQK